ncbi:hypothetical protein [Methanosarcina sp.]|uniref:hypothetical protein n=1 Tax=Methanosarcina sp. TaxID=2213 RepID=UPI003BB53966
MSQILRYSKQLSSHLDGNGRQLGAKLQSPLTFVCNGNQIKIKSYALPYIQTNSKESIDTLLADGQDQSDDEGDDVYLSFEDDIKNSLTFDKMIPHTNSATGNVEHQMANPVTGLTTNFMSINLQTSSFISPQKRKINHQGQMGRVKEENLIDLSTEEIDKLLDI